MLFNVGKLIMSRYIAKSITTDAGRFGRVGLCQLCVKALKGLHSLGRLAKHSVSEVMYLPVSLHHVR